MSRLTDAGRNGRITYLARPNFQGTNRYRGIFFSLLCSADQEQDWQTYPVDAYPATASCHWGAVEDLASTTVYNPPYIFLCFYRIKRKRSFDYVSVIIQGTRGEPMLSRGLLRPLRPEAFHRIDTVGTSNRYNRVGKEYDRYCLCMVF